MPGDNWVQSRHDHASRGRRRRRPSGRSCPPWRSPSADADDALLDAIDVAVTSRGASELRALDDLTFVYEPR